MMANARRAGSRYVPKHEGCDLVHGCWQSFQSTGIVERVCRNAAMLPVGLS